MTNVDTAIEWIAVKAYLPDDGREVEVRDKYGNIYETSYNPALGWKHGILITHWREKRLDLK